MRQSSLIFILAAFAMSCSLLFAGASRPGFAGDTIAQVAAVPALLTGLALTWRDRFEYGWLLGWAAATMLIILVQLLPLPPAIWMHLPLGSTIQAVNQHVGLTDGWRPLSVSPHDTWLSLLALIPPAAVFFATLHLSDHEKARLLKLVLSFAVLSCLLGLWQVAAVAGQLGPGEKPQSVDPTGFFLNRNHYSALLYVAIAIGAAFMIDGWRDALSKPRVLGSATQFASPALALSAIVMALALILLARSRAGMVIAMVSLIGAVLISRLPDGRRLRQGALRWIILAGAGTFILMAQYAVTRIVMRFSEDPLQDGRTSIAETAWSVGWSLMPFGTGLGTFVPVYKAFEEPSAALMGVYVNHAHNDLIEVWMETGIPGLVILSFALVWIGRRLLPIVLGTIETWNPRGRMLSAAAGLSVVLLLAHSLVDYPLRTGALACIFGLGCGILARPIGHGVAAREAPPNYEEETVTAVPEPEEPAVPSAFKKFEMSAARVPAKWRDTPPAEAGKTAGEHRAGRALVLAGAVEWDKADKANVDQRARAGDDAGWPEVWRNRTRDKPQD